MILVTGATGKCGSAAAKELLKKGEVIRVLVRDEAKAMDLLKAGGADIVVGDISQQADIDGALAGCEKALLLLPNSEQQLELEKMFIERAKAAGVKHIVKLSSMEAVADTQLPIPAIHWAAEEYLRASGLDWTMIKPSFFMQNLLGNAVTIKSMQKFFLPLGKGKTGMIDCRDIGAVICEALTGTGHESESYEITGPELLDFYQVADHFSEVLGHKIEYVDQPPEAFREQLSQFLASEWHLNAVCALFGEIAKGGLGHTTDTVRELLGRKPIPLQQFVRNHAAAFQPD
jgi:uncharacterized protein YbjT (DUF2867 family)